MMKIFKIAISLLMMSVVLAVLSAQAQTTRRSRTVASREGSLPGTGINGVYRLDVASSDRLYSVVASASSNLPFAEQQRFFIDLTTRLTPPDQLAIERRGSRVHIASSRAPRTAFEADGREQVERVSDGVTRVRASVAGDELVISSRNSNGETYRVAFTPTESGNQLVVTRQISTRELNQPVVIRSVYNKISNIAQWGIYGEPQKNPSTAGTVIASVVGDTSTAVSAEQEEAKALRDTLYEWIAATNARDIRKQMTFYAPTLRAFYLQRNVPRTFVRAEKARAFESARSIDISAEEPEILFREAGGVAVMRFRKRYAIEGGPRIRRGEVVQELRWQRQQGGWKIFSERDVRVIR